MTKVLLSLIITIFATICATATGDDVVDDSNNDSTICDLTARGDPGPGWVAYVKYTTSNEKRITSVSSKWIMPDSLPEPAFTTTDFRGQRFDKNVGAPGFWMGLQSTNEKGALIQPVLAYSAPALANGCFERDFTDAAENEMFNCQGYQQAGYMR